ncbi:MAG: phosphatidylglycerophosphatase A [Candidatus Omnitrophica bacterium]|nr:phosphatidylglycerophosphatase A [Candidatus Omnitrophota bacterium]
MAEKISKLVATGLGLGYIPVGPGTFGSLGALFWVPSFTRLTQALQTICYAACFLIGVWASDRTVKTTGHPDPPNVVIDEVCGILATFIFIQPTLTQLALGFIIFRIMDIFKLPLIRRLESLPGGWGIMLDDLAAGVVSNLLLRLAASLIA